MEDKRLAKRISNTKGEFVGYLIFCPACDNAHSLDERWLFNGNLESPTFSPSLLLRGKVMPTDEECDRISNGEKVELADLVCHSFITDGKIQYLGDCTHDFKNQTIELKPFWNK